VYGGLFSVQLDMELEMVSVHCHDCASQPSVAVLTGAIAHRHTLVEQLPGALPVQLLLAGRCTRLRKYGTGALQPKVPMLNPETPKRRGVASSVKKLLVRTLAWVP
jgi:hypothetical protein